MKALVLQCIPFESGSESLEDVGEPPGADNHSDDALAPSAMLQHLSLPSTSVGL